MRAHALARTLLDRHGVVTRGAVAAEGVEGGFSAVYRILAAFEESGQARRGYVVEGLGAAQFAMEGAVDRLRAVSNARERGEGPPGRPDFTGGGFDAHISPDGPGQSGDPVFGGSPFYDFPPGDHGHAGAPDRSGDVFAASPQLPPSRGDYVSPATMPNRARAVRAEAARTAASAARAVRTTPGSRAVTAAPPPVHGPSSWPPPTRPTPTARPSAGPSPRPVPRTSRAARRTPGGTRRR